MSSRREEERNEKIIRGLMKLPPNRRCINCNSLGPQYVCTNFWTFVCTTCSGIHREFTHRVKSVSMAKFTSQEVDSLQKGGNQRAREIYLKAWDMQKDRLPDNSKIDKVREFIKNVYVNRKYALENSSDKPPRDPQGLRNHEEEVRRASSYHSYSQSPPYDFEYEERRYGKQTLTRKPGSDRGLYEGKLSSFLSLGCVGDHANDDRFASEGSDPRASDFSVSSAGDPVRSEILSPSSQRDTESSFSETSRNISSEFVHQTAVPHKSDSNCRSIQGGISYPHRTASSGSLGSFAEVSHNNSSVSHAQASASGTFNGLDLFAAPFEPENVASTQPSGSNTQFSESSLSQLVNLFEPLPVSSVSPFTEQQSSQFPQPSALDSFSPVAQQQPASSSNGANVVMPDNKGWANFDTAPNLFPAGTEYVEVAGMPVSNQNISQTFNPFSFDQSFPIAAGHEHEGLQTVETTSSVTPFWNAFEDSAAGQPVQNVVHSNEQAIEHCGSDANISISSGVSKVLDGACESKTPSSSLSSHFNFSTAAVAGAGAIPTIHKPSNPFDLPYDPDMESDNVSQFWDMSSLQAALPSTQKPASYIGDVNQSWFPQNTVPSYVPDGVVFDHPTGSFGLLPGQTPNAQIMNISAQGPVASVGGNPFA